MVLSLVLLSLCMGMQASEAASLPDFCKTLYEKRHKATSLLKNPPVIFDVVTHNLFAQSADLFIMLVDDTLEFGDLKTLPEKCAQGLRHACRQAGFKGQAGDQLMFTIPHGGPEDNDPVSRMALVGIGPKTDCVDDRIEALRRGLAHAFHIIEATRAYRVAFSLPVTDWCDDVVTLGHEVATTLMISAYHFDAYLTKKTKSTQYYAFTFSTSAEHADALKAGMKRGSVTAAAVNLARYWSDLPSSVATPRFMARQAKKAAKRAGLVCKVLSPTRLKTLGMNGILSVARGSTEPCRLVVLEYHSSAPQAQTVVLVGKGVTFDSGGISLKTPGGMEDMKHDMAGAAAVLATMELVAAMQPRVNVIAVVPFVENMPSGSALKPGDIITFCNGMTAEIKNTDAEGRLILADALAYSVKEYHPDLIIDLATLTGACLYALGRFFAGLMTQHYEAGNLIIEAGNRSGDKVWVLPLHTDYKSAIKSTVADVANLGSPSYAGMISAAWFLQHFVQDTPWVHLDIAGPAHDVPLPYYRPGATGYGVKLLDAFFQPLSTATI